ncbi:MAG: cytochrome P450, partial [Candidatus Dormibacteraeota bacterium]|nr:cytochrome P450 [Candidatus Dormibacteraeota bacterium]
FWSRPFEMRDQSFAWLRRHAPVSWHPPLETPEVPGWKPDEAGFWAVTTVADIVEVSRHHDLFSSSVGQVNLRPAPFRLSPNMLVMDPPLHTAYRRALSDAFTPRAVARLEGRIRRRARQIVARVATLGRFDVVREVSAQLPLHTLAGLLGVPPGEQDRFVLAADAYAGARLPAELPPGLTMESFHALQREYLESLTSTLAAHRRSHPADDLMTRLVQARIQGRPLTQEEILSTVLMLVVAGDETTKQAITLSILALWAHPEQRAWLREDYESRIDGALDELIRYASPILVFARTATRDTVLHGVPLTAGDKVALFYCSGNRDEAVFTDPGRLDLARPHAQHVAFGGGGVHFCLGSVVARAQMAALLREVLTRLPGLEVGEPEHLLSDFINGVERLPARLR